jgi:oligopeptide/dipeptide ABC transporter ATP-binding protein
VFVSHDLAIVRYMADRIAVMYLGEVIEEGSAESFDHRPVHPYTEALFSATHQPDPMATSQRVRLVGQVSEADKLRPGCIFSPRCHRHGADCDETKTAWRDVSERRYRCHWSSVELRAQDDHVAHCAGGIRYCLKAPWRGHPWTYASRASPTERRKSINISSESIMN